MVCFGIDEGAAAEESGTIAVCRRFNRYIHVAQQVAL
jgi:hypothetical protein